jgi:hypothetical protein
MPIPTSLHSHLDENGRITKLPVKLSKKIALAVGLLEEFQVGRDYTESEVNEILYAFVDDFALIRRTLVERGELGREKDCSLYWRVPATPGAQAED